MARMDGGLRREREQFRTDAPDDLFQARRRPRPSRTSRKQRVAREEVAAIQIQVVAGRARRVARRRNCPQFKVSDRDERAVGHVYGRRGSRLLHLWRIRLANADRRIEHAHHVLETLEMVPVVVSDQDGGDFGILHSGKQLMRVARSVDDQALIAALRSDQPRVVGEAGDEHLQQQAIVLVMNRHMFTPPWAFRTILIVVSAGTARVSGR